MRQRPFTADGSVASTAAINAACEVGWNGVAPVPQLACGWLSGAWIKWLRLITQQHAGDNVPWLIVAWSIPQRSYPVLPIPGNDSSIARQPGALFHRTRGTEV